MKRTAIALISLFLITNNLLAQKEKKQLFL